MASFVSDGLSFNSITIATSLIAGVLSGWMFIGSIGERGLPGCGVGSSCDEVTRGRWSRWGPVPVSLLGAGAYFLIASMAAVSHTPNSTLGEVLFSLSLIVIGAAMWFTGIQLLLLRRLCFYCAAANACGTVGGLLTLTTMAPWRTSAFPVECMAAGAVLIILVGGQIVLPSRRYLVTVAPEPLPKSVPVETVESIPSIPLPIVHHSIASPAGVRRLRFVRGNVEVDSDAFPIIGSSNPSEVVAFLMDYTCKTCHHLHRLLLQAVEQSAGSLSVVMISIPMHKSCNPAVECDQPEYKISCAYARLGWAVWAAGPDVYARWLDFLTDEEDPKPFGLALIKAKELAEIGRYEFREPIPALDTRIAAAVEIYRRARMPKLPALLLPIGMLRGHVPDIEVLQQLLRQHVSSMLFNDRVAALQVEHYSGS